MTRRIINVIAAAIMLPIGLYVMFTRPACEPPLLLDHDSDACERCAAGITAPHDYF